MSFFAELKRRNVFRVAVAYIIATWLLLQAIDFALDVIGAPNWIMQVLVLLGVLGLPVVLAFAWAFEMTPEGLKRESELQRDESITTYTAKKLDKLTIVLLIAVVVIVIADRFMPDTAQVTEPLASEPQNLPQQLAPVKGPAAKIPSVAVLPFTNMSSDPDNEYFSDGISEELLNLLVQVKGLRVPSRTSSFAFKGKNISIKDIARQLAVEHVLEGSVRKSGNQVRITAQLIDVTTDTHVWSNTYNRELKNIFAIQDEISREIIRELKIALDTSGLLSRDDSRPTENMQAYQDYLRGRHFFIQRGVPSLKASVAALQSAVASDPNFTEAWAALSQTAATLSGWDQENTKEYNQIALDTGNRALQLDENSATALAGLGLLSFNKSNWAQSLKLLKRAATLSKDSTPTYFYGLVLQTTGYINEAREKLLTAEKLDPVYPQLQGYLGMNAMAHGDSALARVHFQRTIDGGNPNGPYGMYWVDLDAGDINSAIQRRQEIGGLVGAGLIKKGVAQDYGKAISAALGDPALLESGIKAAAGQKDLISLSYFGADAEIMRVLSAGLAEGRLIFIAVYLGSYLWAPEFSELRQMPEYKQFLRDFGLVELWKTRGWPDLCSPIGKDDFQCD